MHIAVVGLSHRTAPVEVREKLSIPEELIDKSFNNLKKIDQILEVSILSTCNRLEIYSLVKDPQLGIDAIKSFLLEFSGLDDDILFPHLFNYVQEKAVSHVMRVSAGFGRGTDSFSSKKNGTSWSRPSKLRSNFK